MASQVGKEGVGLRSEVRPPSKVYEVKKDNERRGNGSRRDCKLTKQGSQGECKALQNIGYGQSNQRPGSYKVIG